MNAIKGKLFVIEGGDGSGKPSVVRFLKQNLDADKFIFTREPGGTRSEMAEEIRTLILSPFSKSDDPDTLFHLFWASRIEHIKRIILPALQQGKYVVTDRFDV